MDAVSTLAPAPAAASNRGSAAYAPRRRFATAPRVRSGCMTCKTRKKKCDEIYTDGNSCQTCVRLGLVCERVPLRTVQPKAKSRRRSSVSPSPASLSPVSPSASIDRSVSVQAQNDMPLLTCKPYAGSHFMSLFLLENTSPERILLKYYVEELASLCTIVKEASNGFQNVLLPMAIDDPSLLYALFAYASFHLSSTTSVPDILRLSRLKFESEAARRLSDAIRQNTVSASSIACALICSTAEVVSGSTKRWLIHLQGAGHLIAQQGGPEQLRRTHDGLFLLRNFAYHDILAALSTGGRPQIRGVYWADDEPTSADCLMGLTHDILGHISDMCLLMADAKDCEFPAACSSLEFIHRGEDIAQNLHAQPLHQGPSRASEELDILLHHAEAFRYASLLHLYRFLCRFSTETYQPKMAECVESIMAHVSFIPLNFHCELGLVFPLFMIGIADHRSETTGYVWNRLDNIFNWTKFEHVLRARSLLETLWDTGRTDWEQVLQELGWQISIA